MNLKEYILKDVWSHLKKNNPAKIRYPKKTPLGEDMVEREIIPTRFPTRDSLVVKAIDVTGMPEAERNQVLSLVKEYSDYLEAKNKTVFSFEDFVQHTCNDKAPRVAWKSFLTDKLEILD
jgi:hypothetical protein